MSNTTNIQEARAALTVLEAERDKQAVEAANADRQAKQLRSTISRLVGSMAIDKTDFTQQINDARADLARTEQIVRLWPDVETEIERRIEEARTEVRRHEIQLMVDGFHQLAADEQALREQFYEKGLEFLEVADKLAHVFDAKEAKRRQLEQQKVSTRDVPPTEFPSFYVGWPRIGNGAQRAREEWGIK